MTGQAATPGTCKARQAGTEPCSYRASRISDDAAEIFGGDRGRSAPPLPPAGTRHLHCRWPVDGTGQPESATLQLVDARLEASRRQMAGHLVRTCPVHGRPQHASGPAQSCCSRSLSRDWCTASTRAASPSISEIRFKLTLADHEGSYGSPIAYTPRLWEAFQAAPRL